MDLGIWVSNSPAEGLGVDTPQICVGVVKAVPAGGFGFHKGPGGRWGSLLFGLLDFGHFN